MTLAQGTERLSTVDCIWYIAITEWVTIAQPRLFLEIERDVRSGELAYQLMRPTSYLLSKLCEAWAELIVSLFVLGMGGFAFAYLLSGGLPNAPAALVWALPLGLLAGLLHTLCSALIGITAFWLVDCAPLAWIFQKLVFVLGGLLVPLALYPEWLRQIALSTPFSALVHGPGQSALGASDQQALAVVGQLALWIVVVSALLAVLYRRAQRAVDLHGG